MTGKQSIYKDEMVSWRLNKRWKVKKFLLTFCSRKKINKIKNEGKGLNKKILPLDIGKVNIQTKKPALGFISNLILDIKGTQQKGKYILLMAKHF